MRSRQIHSNRRSILLACASAGVLVITTPFVVLAGEPPATTTPVAFEPASPESQGMSAEALRELNATVEGYLERDLIVGGELVVIKNRRVVLHEVYGQSDREENAPWRENTICNIRSMTKPLTGAAVQILVDRGQVSLDDPVAKYLPGFDTDESRAITIGQLMAHRGGLPLSIMATRKDMTKYDSLIEQANAVGEGGPEFEPGSKFWYSDAGSDVLAAVVEVVTKKTIDEFWQEALFGPLGMGDTFVPLSTEDPRFQRIASLYAGAPHMWGRFWSAADGPFYPYAWGSQTVYSTPLDYAKFLAMWLDGGMAGGRRILSKAAIERTLTPTSRMSALGSDEPYPTELTGLEPWYGQMSILYMPKGNPTGSKPVVIGHSGSDGTAAWAWPDRDLMILYFTQSRGGLTALRIEEAIDRLLIHPGRADRAEAVPAEYEAYVGTYIANFGQFRNEGFEVLVKDGKLALDVPSQMTFQLLDPDQEGRWKFAIAPQVAVTFPRDDEGNVNLMRMHQGGTTFDIPRKGTALAAEMAKLPTVAPEAVSAFLGTYHDPEADADLEVFLEEGVLAVKTPQGLVFHLVPTEESNRWQVKELPIATLTFDSDESGTIVSMTRHIGEETLVMPRVQGGDAEHTDGDE